MYSEEWHAMSDDALGVDRQAYYWLTIARYDHLYGRAIKAGNDELASVPQ